MEHGHIQRGPIAERVAEIGRRPAARGSAREDRTVRVA
jgi:hypothetical protein